MTTPAAPYRRPTLSERYPIDDDTHRDMPTQLPHEIQSSIGEPYVVAGGCNCAACVQARIGQAAPTPAAGPDAAPDSPATPYVYGDLAVLWEAVLELLVQVRGIHVSTIAQTHSEADYQEAKAGRAKLDALLKEIAACAVPDDNDNGVIDPPAWAGRPVAPAWRHALDPIETSGDAARAVPDGTGAAEEGTG